MTVVLAPEMSIASIIAAQPEAESVLARLGIDNCCGAHASLAEHCDRLRLDAVAVIRELGAPRAPDATRQATLQQIYSQLREALPPAIKLGGRVAAAHGVRRPELAELQGVLELLARGVAGQINEAEQCIAPMLGRSSVVGPAQRSELVARIADRGASHRTLRDLLARARDLTGGFNAPADACGSWRMLMRTLAELESSVLAFIHAERNELFPAVLRLVKPSQAENAA
jgi:regulator of cell morphogenesis and NO signaling